MALVSAIRTVRILLALLVICTAASAFAGEPASSYTVEIADVGKSAELAALLSARGYRTSIPEKNMWVVDPQSNCAVWIGRNIPLALLRDVLPEAFRFNPYLKFFHVVGDRGEQPPEKVDNTLHIGGNIEAALVKKLNVIEKEELLDKLKKASTVEELHRYLHDKNSASPSAQKPAS